MDVETEDREKIKELNRWNFIYQLYQRIYIAEKELEFCRDFMEEALPEEYSEERPQKFDAYINSKWEEYRQKHLDLQVRKQQNKRRLRTRIFQKEVVKVAEEERRKANEELEEKIRQCK